MIQVYKNILKRQQYIWFHVQILMDMSIQEAISHFGEKIEELMLMVHMV